MYLLSMRVFENDKEACKRACNAQGKDFVAAPVGTAVGRSMEGGSNPTEPTFQCTCVAVNR